jgi:hypothetical protein
MVLVQWRILPALRRFGAEATDGWARLAGRDQTFPQEATVSPFQNIRKFVILTVLQRYAPSEL